MRRRALFAGVLLLLGGAPAWAVDFRVGKQPFRLDLTESLYLSYRTDPGNGRAWTGNYGELVSRLNVQLAWRSLVLGLRLDSAAWFDIPALGEKVFPENCPEGAMTPDGRMCFAREVGRNDYATQGFPRFPGFTYGGEGPPGVAVEGKATADRHRLTLYDPRKLFEKFFLNYTGRNVEATLGDFYINFGRGLVLSVRKVDELGVDTTLLGAKALVRERDFLGTVFAGWSNIQNLDEATATYMPDWVDNAKSKTGDRDFLAGARAEYRAGGEILIGLHGVGFAPAQSPGSKRQDYGLRYGITIDIPRPLPWLKLYAEYARADDQERDKPKSGNAVYAQAAAFAGPTSWLVEFQDYRAYDPWKGTNNPFGSLIFQQLPTLERAQVPVNNNTDITAARVRVDWTVRPQTIVYASFKGGRSLFDERQDPSPHNYHILLDAYVGAQLRWAGGRSYIFPLVGYRHEMYEDNKVLYDRLVQIEWDAGLGLPRGFSIESQGTVWLRENRGEMRISESGQEVLLPWQEGNVYLALKWAPRLILVGGFEFTTAQSEQLARHFFFNGSLQWNITSATSLRLFAGGQRPGLRCVSGICRVFPTFTGARLEAVIRF